MIKNNTSMVEAAKQIRRDYQNQWRRKNRDKVKTYNQRYWEKKAAALAASVQSGENNDDRKD